MENINIYTNEEKSRHQPTLFEFFTDEELEVADSEIQDTPTSVSDLIN